MALIFPPGQEGISEDLRRRLEAASETFGQPMRLTSAHQGRPDRPGSMHPAGGAVDVDMGGMDDSARARLVEAMRAQGIPRYGTYDKHPNMLHADMSQAQGGPWFMHNTTNAQIGNAPAWFRAAAGAGAPDVRMAGGDPAMMVPGNPRGGRMNDQSPLSDPTILARLGILPQAQQPYVDSGPRNPYPAAPQDMNPLIAAIVGIAANRGSGGGIMSGLANAGEAISESQKSNMLTHKAMAEQWRLDEEMGIKREENDIRRRSQLMSGVPNNVQEMLILKQMYPNMNDADIMSMAFAGRVPTGGTKVEKVGDRLFNVNYDQMGRPTYQPLNAAEQADYEKTIGSQKKIEKIGETFGKAHVDALINTSGEYQKASSALNTTENLLNRFESGEFDKSVGPVAGRLGHYFDPKTSQVQAMEMSSALANLGIQNLAPVSNYEIDLIKSMDASSYNNKAQNIAILRDLQKVRKAKADTLKRTLDRLKTESIDQYMANPETINVPLGGVGAGSPARSESPASATAPTAGAGDPDLDAYNKWSKK